MHRLSISSWKNIELISKSVLLLVTCAVAIFSLVSSKLTLRDEVLKAHTGGAGSVHTKEVLRGPASFQLIYLGLCLNL